MFGKPKINNGNFSTDRSLTSQLLSKQKETINSYTKHLLSHDTTTGADQKSKENLQPAPLNVDEDVTDLRLTALKSPTSMISSSKTLRFG